MAARRSLSLVLACLATVLLLAWNLFHDQFLGSWAATIACLGLAGCLAVQAVRYAWRAPHREAFSPRS